jgi:hypothetical protein
VLMLTVLTKVARKVMIMNANVDSRTQNAHRLDFALGKQHKLAPEAQGCHESVSEEPLAE